DITGYHWLIVVVTLAVVGVAVLLHFEILGGISRRLDRLSGWAPRSRVLLVIIALMLTHVLEIWLFGVVYYVTLQWPGFGHLHAPGQAIGVETLFDFVYYSAVVYTTLGFGDMVPVGPVRFLTGTQSLVGLVLITWSASFTYLQMERHWNGS
ncbi:MAG TPA: potassium channel family protein, partial [Gammaproteobacteria bacterium]|nr:potassium channel family protein [Gammaproteobacteria bacterium]